MSSSSSTSSSSCHGEIKRKLEKFFENQRIPNIIFHGPSSCEKNELILDFIHLIYDRDKSKIKKNVMFVNCAQGKGIKFIREELKFFAKTNVVQNHHQPPPQDGGGGNNTRCVNFKSIILLNTDALSFDAQSALRRCIELFSNSSRFFLVLDNKNKLLKPILSRFCLIYIIPAAAPAPPAPPATAAAFSSTTELARAVESSVISELAVLQMSGAGDDGTRHHQVLMKLVSKMYNAGITCYDLVEMVNRDKAKRFAECGGGEDADFLRNEEEMVDLVVVFQKVRREFRSEKLLLFFLLDYVSLIAAGAKEKQAFLQKISLY